MASLYTACHVTRVIFQFVKRLYIEALQAYKQHLTRTYLKIT
jgi:hypothetical protein